jgi:hypothetical protein
LLIKKSKKEMKMKKQRILILFVGLLLVSQVFYAGAAEAQDAQKIERLERLIREQQQQLESMQRQLDQLEQAGKERLDVLEQAAEEARKEAEEAKSLAEEQKTEEQGHPAPPPETITSGQGRVKLAISGQVNRAVNIADDGKDTEAYFVDNDASNTRVRFVGTAKATEDLTIGSKIELAIAPNESSDVNQDNEESGDFFDQRWAEVSLDSKRFGKLSLGKGDTASNNTAEVDLSRTDVVQYASIADIAGGLKFRQNNGDTLTDVKVSDAFKDEDGLSRKSRLRYDTPTFYGFSLAGSLVSDQRYDASLWWGGQGLGFKVAAAAAFADPNEENTDYQYDGSFSILHENTGLNLTLSAGLKERDDQGDAKNYYAKAGWLTRFFSFGQTAFGVDYTRSVNLPTGRDKGYSVGGAVVQQFEEFGTELYLQYRLYSLDRDAASSVQDINVGTIGARVKF